MILTSNPFGVFALLFIGHAIADYPLQGDWLSKVKNPTMAFVPGEIIWPGALACHAAIHAGFVWVITGSPMLASLEFVAHTAIDYAKCVGKFGYNVDQTLHVLCKAVWVGLLPGAGLHA